MEDLTIYGVSAIAEIAPQIFSTESVYDLIGKGYLDQHTAQEILISNESVSDENITLTPGDVNSIKSNMVLRLAAAQKHAKIDELNAIIADAKELFNEIKSDVIVDLEKTVDIVSKTIGNKDVVNAFLNTDGLELL